MGSLKTNLEQDEKTWDECAQTYENQIVNGHPDILAFEEFEEDFLDHLLRFLITSQDRLIKLMDIGCGSGRLHMRYATKTSTNKKPDPKGPSPLSTGKLKLHYDHVLATGLAEVWGIDFSGQMIELAKKKIQQKGLNYNSQIKLSFEQGSAFDLPPEDKKIFPVLVCLVNSIGVMQGPRGAVELFKSLKRAVEKAQGIAIISCYRQGFLETYGLGQYESTMDVSGQPTWLEPDTYASALYTQVPQRYKYAYSMDSSIVVDVFDENGQLVKKDHTLSRIQEQTKQILKSGHITTHSNYESNWYSFEQIEEWINTHWDKRSFHFTCNKIDLVRAEPAQMAIYDPGHNLTDLFKYWNVSS